MQYYNNFMPQSKVVEVNGLNGANAYQIAPNSSVLLLDNNLPIVYLKQTDGGGYATISTFDLVEHKDQATKNMEDITSRLNRLENSIEQLIEKQSNSNESIVEQSSNSTSNAIMQNERYETTANGTRDSKSKRH